MMKEAECTVNQPRLPLTDGKDDISFYFMLWILNVSYRRVIYTVILILTYNIQIGFVMR